MSDYKDRPRKIDVNQMTTDQVDKLQAQISSEMAKIMDEANTKCNEMLNIYGLRTKINYNIVQIAEKTPKKPKAAKRMKKDLKAQSLSKLQE